MRGCPVSSQEFIRYRCVSAGLPFLSILRRHSPPLCRGNQDTKKTEEKAQEGEGSREQAEGKNLRTRLRSGRTTYRAAKRGRRVDRCRTKSLRVGCNECGGQNSQLSPFISRSLDGTGERLRNDVGVQGRTGS